MHPREQEEPHGEKNQGEGDPAPAGGRDAEERDLAGTGKILAHFSDSPIGLLHGSATLPAASRPDSGGRPHSLSATHFGLAVTSMRAEFPLGKVPTARVRLRISWFRRSMALLVLIRLQCSRGKRV